ncbi:hypothetical protein HDK64DRAFT_316426, partial [Phyllosticta capitalensis]
SALSPSSLLVSSISLLSSRESLHASINSSTHTPTHSLTLPSPQSNSSDMSNSNTAATNATTMTTSTPASAPPAAAALGMWEMVLVQMVPPLADTRLEVRYRDDDDDALKLHRDVGANDEMLEWREGLDLGLSLGLGWERELAVHRSDGHGVCSGCANDDDNDGSVNGVEVVAASLAASHTTTTSSSSASPCLPTASIAFTQPLDNGASVSLLPQNNNNTSTRALVLQMLITLLISILSTTIYTIIALTLSLSLAKRTERFLLTQRKASLKRQIQRLRHAMTRTAHARLDRIVECCCMQHGNFLEACEDDAVVRALEDEEERLGMLLGEKERQLGRTRACLRGLERGMARGTLRWRRGRLRVRGRMERW